MTELSRTRQAEVRAVKRAVKLLGGQKETAHLLSDALKLEKPLTPGTVSHYCTGRVRLPAECCIPLEELTAARVTRYQLRRDIYPTPLTAAAVGARK